MHQHKLRPLVRPLRAPTVPQVVVDSEAVVARVAEEAHQEAGAASWEDGKNF